jgi:hypothetical protein
MALKAGTTSWKTHRDSIQTSFPVTGGPDLTHNGGMDAFVAKVCWLDRGYHPAWYCGGSYFVIAVADADNTASETNEGNNTRARRLKVTP